MNTSVLRILAKVGYELYGSSIWASQRNPAKFDRMKAVNPGDVVIELSTAAWWMRGDENVGLNMIGILDKITFEPYPREEGDEPWDEAKEGKPEPLEKVFYIKLMHEDKLFRWTNANFCTILPVEGWPL